LAKKEERTTPKWYLSMDQYLTILNDVVRQSDTYVTGKYVHETMHPEDLSVTVQSAAETVALTITAIGKYKSHMLEDQ
jgi:hypothetical protein